MGIIASCARASDDSFHGVRVVQLGGLVEEFDNPVKVKYLTAQNPKHFVCSCRSLQAIKPCPLPAEEELQMGELYFLLPFATLEGELSPSNLVSLATKLIAAAKKANAAKSPPAQKQRSPRAAVSRDDFHLMPPKSHLPVDAGDCNGQCQNPGRGKANTVDCPELELAYRERALFRSKTWKPRLNTIDESFCVR